MCRAIKMKSKQNVKNGLKVRKSKLKNKNKKLEGILDVT